MLSRKLIFCMVGIFSLINCASNGALCESKECCNMESPNQCYCSRKCGPREKDQPGDSPVWVNGICFCQQWDADNYETNQCNKKDQEKESEIE